MCPKLLSSPRGAMRRPADPGAAVPNAIGGPTAVAPAAIDDAGIGCVCRIGEQPLAFGRTIALASQRPEGVPAVPT